MTEEKTLRFLLTKGTAELQSAGIENADGDARELLLSAFDLSWNGLILNYEKSPFELYTKEKAERGLRGYTEAIARRKAHVPLQYITNSQNFCGLELYVDERVLIPRQDTEALIETVLDARGKKETLLDVCTGSGCIALALKELGGFKTAVGVDLSDGALAVAEKNASITGNEVRFLKSDLFSVLREGREEVPRRFDIITSNPPYIPSGVIETLTPEVRDHEPLMALDGTEDGLFFYRKLAEEAPDFLTEGGQIFFEIGYDQAEAVMQLLIENGFTEVRCVKDLAGLDRVVTGRK